VYWTSLHADQHITRLAVQALATSETSPQKPRDYTKVSMHIFGQVDGEYPNLSAF